MTTAAFQAPRSAPVLRPPQLRTVQFIASQPDYLDVFSPSGARDLPRADRWTAAVAAASVECLLGSRPVSQLARLLAPTVYDALAARIPFTNRLRGKAHPAVRPIATHVYPVAPGVFEGSCTVHDGERYRAAAMRVIDHRGRWKVVSLEVG